MSKSNEATKQKKTSTVRHARAIQRDRSKRPASAPPDEQVVARIHDLVHPATLAQIDHYEALGLCARILTRPVMMALVLSLLWQQTALSGHPVNELVRIVQIIETYDYSNQKYLQNRSFGLFAPANPHYLFFTFNSRSTHVCMLDWRYCVSSIQNNQGQIDVIDFKDRRNG